MVFSRELPSSFGDALKTAQQILSSNQDLVAKNVIQTEAEQIVAGAYRKATGQELSRMELYSRVRDRFPEQAGHHVLVLAGARAEGKLLQHLLGYQTFLDHEYEVSSQVLVPRPETELLVAIAVEELRKGPQGTAEPYHGLEVGIGSGIISIELLWAFPKMTMTASELTQGAAACARSNANRILGSGAQAAGRLSVLLARQPLEVWEPFIRAMLPPVDFLITNPPYLAQSDEIDPEVIRHEPATALYGPEKDPVHFYREIARGAARHLRPGGWVFAEIPPERSRPILELFAENGFQVDIVQDLNGRDRVLRARWTK